MAYTTIAKVSSYLQTNIDDTTTPNSTDVNNWIDWADSLINEESGRCFGFNEEEDSIFVASEKSCYDIWLPSQYTPVISIDKLYLNQGTDFETDWVEQTADTYYVIADKVTGHIKLRTPTKANIRSVKIDGLQYGYEEVPSIVEELSTRLASEQYIKSSLSNNVSENADGITVGPITVRKSTSQNVSFIKNMKEDINYLMDQLGKFKTYIK